jgi:hypothetical protein
VLSNIKFQVLLPNIGTDNDVDDDNDNDGKRNYRLKPNNTSHTYINTYIHSMDS